MKTKKIAASVMSAALCLSSVIPYAASAEAEYKQVIGADVKSGSSAAMAYTLGDVDGDASVTAKDATAVLTEYAKTSVGKEGSFSDRAKKSADVDRNGKIDGVDASTILSFYAYSSVGGELDLPGYLEQVKNGGSSTTTTTAAATTKAEDKTIGTNDEITKMVEKDYFVKTGKNAASSETNVNKDGTLTVELKDENGNVIDKYTVDPETGKGTDADGNEVDLPQTGINSLGTAGAAVGAVMLMLAGAAAVHGSGVLRKKEND